MEAVAAEGKKINVQVVKLGGGTLWLQIDDDDCATVWRLNALIDKHWGHPARVQTLILDKKILDQFALLRDVGVRDQCVLQLILSADEGTATSNFLPQEENQIALAVGDRVTVSYDPPDTPRREQDNHQWVMGKNERTGEKGWFPLSYLDAGNPAMHRHPSYVSESYFTGYLPQVTSLRVATVEDEAWPSFGPPSPPSPSREGGDEDRDRVRVVGTCASQVPPVGP